jgi:hypothetical protein
MRERAAMLGGHVSASPTLHGGFQVKAFLPRDGAIDDSDEDLRGLPEAEYIFPDPPTGEENP